MHPFRGRLLGRLIALAILLPSSASGQPATPPAGVAFSAGFQPGGQQLFALDLRGTPIGEFPTNLEFRNGTMEVVLKNGVRMLKASAASEFVITLPQVLPQDFTLEFDLIPKAGGPPPDLSLEGTPRINQGEASAHLLWQADGYLAVIGGAQDNYETPMPEDFRASLPGVRTQVGVSVSGSTIKLYTNGRRLFTLDRQFARRDVLRVFLGGVDDVNAVYLAGLRIAMGAPLLAGGQQSGQPQKAVNPLPVVPKPNTQHQQNPSNTPQQPQTATNQFGLSGATSSGAIAVTVTLGPNGPLVSWPAVPSATGYMVTRSKSDDLNCCNASSGRSWAATSPWQDGPPPIPGTYIYTVIANTRQGGQLQGQTPFDFGVTAGAPAMPQVNPPIAANAGIPPSSFAITVTLGSAGPVVSWPAVPNATAYAVGRWKIDDPNCCNNSSGRGYGATSPWQDQPLPMSGTYVYRVEALTTLGSVLAETQFGFRMPGGAPAPTLITTIASPTATTTPMPAPATAPSPTPATPGSTVLTPTRPTGVSPNQTTWPNTGPPPAAVSVSGSPIRAQVVWSPPQGAPMFVAGSGISYTVSRAVAGSTNFTGLTAAPITTINFFDDMVPDHRVTYTYAVTALHPDGTSGTATADYTPPPPADPTNFAAIVKGIDEVELTWWGTAGPAQYFITGPGTGNGITVAGVPDVNHRLHHNIKGLPAGNHTWKIASSYTPGGVLTSPAQWPAASATLAMAGKYEISIESVKLQSPAVDDVLHTDGLQNEFYVTAFVRTTDNSGKILSETSHKSPTFGDITFWPPPARVRAGSAGGNGGVWDKDLVTPIWNEPAPGAKGYSRMVLWSGTLTAGMETVDVAPVIWESDNNPIKYYDGWLKQTGYYLLDLDTRTASGEISNVMLPDEYKAHVGANYGNFLPISNSALVGVDRPIGIAKDKQDWALDARWWIIAIRFNQTVAEAALSGKYGPPGIIALRLVDHITGSKSTYSHPDIGMGDYTLNIRISRLP